jgi:hypothetical protein
MFQHFGQRLKRDLKLLVDRRLDASVLASGSMLKVILWLPVIVIIPQSSPSHLGLKSTLSLINAKG